MGGGRAVHPALSGPRRAHPPRPHFHRGLPISKRGRRVARDVQWPAANGRQASMIRQVLFFLALSVALFAARNASAHMDGTTVAGYSGIEPGKVCNSCHVGGTQSTLTLGGPNAVKPGATAHFVLSIANAKAVYGGVDIAADNKDVKLQPNDETLVNVGQELVHKTRTPFENGVLKYEFDFTAPTATGVVTLYADGVQGHEIDTPLGDMGNTATFTVKIDPSAPESHGGPGGEK